MMIKNINAPATIVHTVNKKTYRLDGTLLAINESAKTCTMKFGDKINNNIPLCELYLTEGILDKIKEYGKQIWNKIRNVVKSAAGFLLPVSEKGELLVSFLNTPINLISIPLPKSITYAPDSVSLALAKTQNMDIINDNTSDDAMNDLLREDINTIKRYWSRVMSVYATDKNTTIKEAVKYTNEHFYRPVANAQALNESALPTLHNLVKNGYGPEVSRTELVGILETEILHQLRPNTTRENEDPKTICIWGAPGIGKTAILKNAMNLVKDHGFNLAMITMKCAALSRDDFELPDTVRNAVGQKLAISTPKSWLPVYDTAGLTPAQIKKVDEFYNTGAFRIYARAGLSNKKIETTEDNELDIDALIEQSPYNGGIIFFDEFARTPAETMNIMMNLMGERMYGNMPLATKWLCLAASNRLTDDGRSEDDMDFRETWDIAKQSRYKHYTFVPTKEEFLEWAREAGPDGQQNIDEMFCQFIEDCPPYVWYDALDFESRPTSEVDPTLYSALQDTDANWQAIGQSLQDANQNKTLIKLGSWSGRDWDQKINQAVKTALKQQLFEHDPDAYEACFVDTKRSILRTALGDPEEYIVKNLSLSKLEQQLDKVPMRVWDKWITTYYRRVDPGKTLARNNRIGFFTKWISDVVIPDVTGGPDSKPAQEWKNYKNVKEWLTDQHIKSIWETGELAGKRMQKADNILVHRISDYSQVHNAEWKANTKYIKDVINEIIKRYPGNISKVIDNDYKNLQSHISEFKDYKASKKDIDDFFASYNLSLYDNDYDKLININLLTYDDSIEQELMDNIDHIIYTWKYSEFSRQLANVAKFIAKICIQVSSYTFIQESKQPLNVLHDRNISNKALNWLGDQSETGGAKIRSIKFVANTLFATAQNYQLHND